MTGLHHWRPVLELVELETHVAPGFDTTIIDRGGNTMTWVWQKHLLYEALEQESHAIKFFILWVTWCTTTSVTSSDMQGEVQVRLNSKRKWRIHSRVLFQSKRGQFCTKSKLDKKMVKGSPSRDLFVQKTSVKNCWMPVAFVRIFDLQFLVTKEYAS